MNANILSLKKLRIFVRNYSLYPNIIVKILLCPPVASSHGELRINTILNIINKKKLIILRFFDMVLTKKIFIIKNKNQNDYKVKFFCNKWHHISPWFKYISQQINLNSWNLNLKNLCISVRLKVLFFHCLFAFVVF